MVTEEVEESVEGRRELDSTIEEKASVLNRKGCGFSRRVLKISKLSMACIYFTQIQRVGSDTRLASQVLRPQVVKRSQARAFRPLDQPRLLSLDTFR